VCDASKKLSHSISVLLGAAAGAMNNKNSLNHRNNRLVSIFIGATAGVLSHEGISHFSNKVNNFKENQYHTLLMNAIKRDKNITNEFFGRKRNDLKKEDLGLQSFVVNNNLEPEN